METNSVKKSVTSNADINKVWNYVSKITSLSWLEGHKSSKFLSEKKRGVGAIRSISFEDGTNVVEYVVGWRPKKYFSYIVTSGLPIDAYHATISMSKNNDYVTLTWESYFTSRGTKSEFNVFTKFLSNFYAISLNNLKNELEV